MPDDCLQSLCVAFPEFGVGGGAEQRVLATLPWGEIGNILQQNVVDI